MYAQVRYNVRSIFLTIVVSCFIQFIIYEIWSSNTIQFACTSRESCYEHATKIEKSATRTSAFRSGMNALRNLAIARQNLKNNMHPANAIINIDGNLDTNAQLLGQTTERVKAAFVVLVRNRELDDLRSSMRYVPSIVYWNTI